MGANANAIKQFNLKAQQQQQADAAAASFLGKNTAPPPDPNATPVVSLNSSMSASDIQLLTADMNTLSDEQKLRRGALETKQNLKKIEDQKKADQDAQEQQARDRHDHAQVIGHEVARGLRAAGDSRAKAWFENVPTPGGIGILLLVIGVFLLAIVPVDSSGHTRLMLMWLTLTGKTHVVYPEGGGSSGNFASTSTPQTPAPVQGQPAATPLASLPMVLPNVDLGITGFFNL